MLRNWPGLTWRTKRPRGTPRTSEARALHGRGQEGARASVASAYQGSVTEIIDSSGDGAGNLLDRPSGIAVDGSGSVYVTGNLSDNAFFVGGLDTDGDGVVDDDDNFPFVPNGLGEASGAPTWGNQAESAQFPGNGCACLCGDANRDCVVNVQDSAEAQRFGTVPPLPPISSDFDLAFCDLNSDGICNVQDSPEMQRAGTVPPLPPISMGFSVTGCSGYCGASGFPCLP